MQLFLIKISAKVRNRTEKCDPEKIRLCQDRVMGSKYSGFLLQRQKVKTQSHPDHLFWKSNHWAFVRRRRAKTLL